jgi:hypothetical protein
VGVAPHEVVALSAAHAYAMVTGEAQAVLVRRAGRPLGSGERPHPARPRLSPGRLLPFPRRLARAMHAICPALMRGSCIVRGACDVRGGRKVLMMVSICRASSLVPAPIPFLIVDRYCLPSTSLNDLVFGGCNPQSLNQLGL